MNTFHCIRKSEYIPYNSNRLLGLIEDIDISDIKLSPYNFRVCTSIELEEITNSICFYNIAFCEYTYQYDLYCKYLQSDANKCTRFNYILVSRY